MTATSLVIPAQTTAVAKTADALALADQFLAELERQVSAGELSEATRQTYDAGLGRFLDFAVSQRVVNSNVVREWIAFLRSKKHKASTVNTWLAGVRAFFRWAEGEHKISYNPASGIKSAKHTGAHTQHVRDTLTDAEVVRVLALPDDSDAGVRDRAYLHLRAYTGCRDIELHRADVGDLKTKSGRLVLMVAGKGHVEADAFVVVTASAESVVRDWLAVRARIVGSNTGPLFVSLSNVSRCKRLSLRAIRWMVKKYYKAAGVTASNKTSHSLRHAAITNAIRHGAPVQKAKSMARHADVSTTMIYFHEQDRIENPAEEMIRYNGKGEHEGDSIKSDR